MNGSVRGYAREGIAYMTFDNTFDNMMLLFPAFSGRIFSDKVYHQPGQLFSAIFLQKVPPAL